MRLPTPLIPPWTILTSCIYFRPWATPCNYVNQVQDQALREIGNGTDQLQPIHIAGLDVFHDGAIRHPLRYRGESEGVNTPENAGEFEDIWVRQGIPEDNLSAKSLDETFKQH